MCALSWLNVETLERAPTSPLRQTWYALGRSFARDYGICLMKYSDLVCLHVLYSSAVTVSILILFMHLVVLVVQISRHWNYKVHQQLLYIILLLLYSTIHYLKRIAVN